ncbi:MAG: mechanosensitive ion channel family protein [Bacteroidales bacterium]|nr:mechanosensitive ion channel family protein [Bacteroidales bacterium]
MKKIFDLEFWTKYWERIIGWSEKELLSVILLTIFFFIGLWIFKIVTKKLKPFLIKRKLFDKNSNKLEAEKRINTIINITYGSIKTILWILFIVTLLSKFGIDIAPLVAGAGIVGLAIGFGAQELVRDVISGFFILLENQIRVDDVAIINGVAGTVEKIESRTITLRDLSGTVHIFQNGKIDSLSNMTKDWSAIVLEIGVAYKENILDVMQIMTDVSDEMFKDEEKSSKMLENIEIMGLDKFEDSAVVIKARIKTIPGEQWAIGREYRKRLKIAFDANNIEIPFPHTTVYFGKKQIT